MIKLNLLTTPTLVLFKRIHSMCVSDTELDRRLLSTGAAMLMLQRTVELAAVLSQRLQ